MCMTHQVEYPGGVSGELGHLRERGVSPDHNLVLGVAVSTDQLVSTLGPRQVAHLDVVKKMYNWPKTTL